MKPIVPTDINISATPTRNRKFPKANYYITLRRCDKHGEDKVSFYWTWAEKSPPTVADVLGDLTSRVKTVVGFTAAPEWVCATNPKGTVSIDRLPGLVSEFVSNKRMERKLRRFLGRDFDAMLE